MKLKSLAILILSTMLLYTSWAQEVANASKNGRWGVLKRDGSWYIEPRFNDITRFEGNYALAKEGSLWGVIDRSGNWVVEPGFNKIFNITDDGIMRIDHNGGLGYIDLKGNVIVPTGTYTVEKDFKGGAALVREGKKDFMYINKEGQKITLPVDPKSYKEYSEGLVMLEDGKLWGYANSEGQWAIPAQFESVKDFENGKAFVEKDGLWGQIDKSGKFIIKPQFEKIYDFKEGTALAMKDGKFGYIDEQGNWKVNPLYEKGTQSFAGGYAIVSLDGKEGYVSETGKFITVPKNATRLYDFNGGIAMARDEDRIGYLDETGAWKIEPKYIKGYGFQEGMGIALTKDEKWVYINETGNEMTIDGATKLGPFSGGLAVVNKGSYVGYVNKKGELIIPAKYEMAGKMIWEDDKNKFSEGVTILIDNNKYGLMQKDGTWKLEPTLDKIEWFYTLE